MILFFDEAVVGEGEEDFALLLGTEAFGVDVIFEVAVAVGFDGRDEACGNPSPHFAVGN